MTDRPDTCVCGHPRSWHRHDLFAGYVCLLCAVCGREAHEHEAYFSRAVHRFVECDCGGNAA
jgi:hypothetical protein